MAESNPNHTAIEQQILRAIALDRTPGYHFCGNFLGLNFDGLKGNTARVTLPPTPWVIDDNGHIDPFVMAVLTDFALANAVRTATPPEARLATVSLNLQFTGEPFAGELTARAELEGFFTNASGRLAMTRGRVLANDKVVAFGSANFMVLPAPRGTVLHPVPWLYQPVPDLPLPELETLSETEQWLVRRGQETLQSLAPDQLGFWAAFLGIETQASDKYAKVTIPNGPHVGNRVGHVQGGISLGLALCSANRALSEDWRCAGIHASYVSPGTGPTLSSETMVTHRGRLTAVGRTQVLGEHDRVVLDVMTNHARIASAQSKA